ncbi:MAG TPA: acetate kinase [Candidatus Aminicenantes bacterium]|nr:acetate kinase [Candidatus Aminicenantes bacterium]
MIILSLNCGSSSAKYRLYDYDKKVTLATGIVERVTVGKSYIQQAGLGREPIKIDRECPTHKEAIKLIIDTLLDPKIGVLEDLKKISAVGHRVVHGGEKFTKSVKITPETIETFKGLFGLAPLHNPPNVLGIEAALEVLPGIPHVAIMDTAWHQTMPASSYMYALPYEWYEKYGVRRYGFHGTSFLYVAKRAALLLGKDPFDCNLVCLHIGNGVSANAIKKGVSFDTSMGLTPLEGLVMGTRAGDHDAAIDLMMMEREGIAPAKMNDLLNKKSGLLGITGRYTDRRDVQKAAEEGDARAKLAIEVEAYRIKKYIGAYSAAIGGADAIVFTAGVGEMSDLIRERSLEGLEFLGIKLDRAKNKLAKTRNAETEISADDSKVKIFVIPTDEERVNIEDVIAILQGTYDEHTRFTYRFQSPDYVNSQREQDFAKECQAKPGLKAIEVKPKKR